MRIDTKKATRRTKEIGGVIGDRVKVAGGTVGAKAVKVGGKVGTTAAGVGGKLGTTAKRVQTAAAPRARALRGTAADRTRQTRKRVGYWIAGEEPPKRRLGAALGGAALGAAAAFFLDPRNGRRRRALARDWIAARARGLGRRTARAGRGVGARAAGVGERVIRQRGSVAPANDPTLEQKVQSEVFLGLDLSSKEISIMAVNGVVSLRGAVDRPDLITAIEERVRAIDGVRDVENQLHLTGTPAPTTP